MEASKHLRNIASSESRIIIDYVRGPFDLRDVLVTIIHLFNALFSVKENLFPHKEWPHKKILMNPTKMWGKEFREAHDKHHSECNEFMLKFIAQHQHLVQ